MLNKPKLVKKIDEIDEMINKTCVDPSGNKEAIGDGIIDIDKYLKSKPKILWILKEAYCEDGGGWDYREEWAKEGKLWEWVNASSKPTWHPIIYVTYAILNGFLTWNDMDWIRNSPDMAEVLRNIAVINVKKLPGVRQSNNAEILACYNEHKQIILKQIEVFQPDIVIGYHEVLRQIYSDLDISTKNEKRKESCEYVKTHERLYITAYHPGQRIVYRETYVNDIVEAAEEWSNV